MKMLLVASSVVVLGRAGRGGATTHYVVPAGTPGVNPMGDYTSWETAATNIQDAVSVAGTGALVLVTNGVHTLTNQLVIRTALTLRSFNEGATDRDGTVIDGGYPARTNRCIYVDNVAAVIDGFTITNGVAPAAVNSGHGGGVYLYLKGTLTNCVVAGNKATGSGGGVFLYNGGLVNASILAGNVATNLNTYGGGAYVYAAGMITNSLLRGNQSRWGGGAYLWGPSVTAGNAMLIDCDVVGNLSPVRVSGEGGAGIAGNYKSYVSDCRVVSNTIVQYAGSGYNAGVNVGEGSTVRNCLIAYNGGGNYGGGAGCGRGRVFTNCVIRSNSAANGGGVYLSGGLLVDCSVVSNSSALFVQGGTARNCLIVGNNAGIWANSGHGGYYQNCTIVNNKGTLAIGQNQNVLTGYVENCVLYYNGTSGANYTTTATAGIVFTNTCTYPLASGASDVNVITNAPLLADYANFNFRPRGSSPCINAGVWRDWMAGARDRDGRKRVIGPAVDLGVYEYMPQGTALLVR